MNSTTSTEPAPVAASAPAKVPAKSAIQPWQFFLTASLLGAAAVLWVAPPAHPAALLFLSLAVVAAGACAVAIHGVLSALAGRGAEPVRGESLRDALEREKLLTLRAIKDLEFDKAMGKVSDADAAPMEARLRDRALSLMRELDGREALRARIEEDWKATGYGAQAAGQRTAGAGPGSEGEASPNACVACGTANDSDARFCKSCGGRL